MGAPQPQALRTSALRERPLTVLFPYTGLTKPHPQSPGPLQLYLRSPQHTRWKKVGNTKDLPPSQSCLLPGGGSRAQLPLYWPTPNP